MQFANRSASANHSLRTMPPSCTAERARTHDQGMWQTVEIVLHQTPSTDAERALTRDLATSPMRMGGWASSLQPDCAESAFWASWADGLPMITERTLHSGRHGRPVSNLRKPSAFVVTQNEISKEFFVWVKAPLETRPLCVKAPLGGQNPSVGNTPLGKCSSVEMGPLWKCPSGKMLLFGKSLWGNAPLGNVACKCPSVQILRQGRGRDPWNGSATREEGEARKKENKFQL